VLSKIKAGDALIHIQYTNACAIKKIKHKRMHVDNKNNRQQTVKNLKHKKNKNVQANRK
jgi:hypothetical protein